MIPRASERAEKDFLEHGLTTRETNAVRSTLAGMTAAEAATEMGVGASTVGSLRRNAYQKLGATSGRELVRRYAEKNDDGPDWSEALRNHGLNRTQADVLALVAAGLSTAQIAEELHVAPGTVRAARANGYRMLGVHSRRELVTELEHGSSASRRKRGQRLATVCIAAVSLLSLSIAGGQAACSEIRQHAGIPVLGEGASYHVESIPFTATDDEHGIELFGVNENGQRFGRHEYVTAYLGGIANLYAAQSSDGTYGYVRNGEGLNGDDVLLAKDGKTPIGIEAMRLDRFTNPSEPNLDPETTPFTACSPEGWELFGLNDQGQFYGSREFADLYLNGKLDLVAASGKEGNRGYVYSSDLEEIRPSNSSGFIPLFDKGGVTQIDRLEWSTY